VSTEAGQFRLGDDAVLRHEVRHPVRELDIIEGDTTGLTDVTFQCDEISSLCPITGQPDMNAITVHYRPGPGRLIESKSLKLYLWGFRERALFVEELAQEVAQRVMSDARAEEVEVTVRQSVRGGIVTTVVAHLTR
jgi:7-cyano-7-deazaguanine reductase